MVQLVSIIIFLAVWWLICNIGEIRFHNYTPPKGQRIDYNAQSLDKVLNHLSNNEVKSNTVAGKYNVKSDI